jgi:sulfate-transporting ATPase
MVSCFYNSKYRVAAGFLDRVATHIMAFEGDSKVVWFDGNYSDYEKNRKERLGKEADVPKRIKYAKLTR